MKITYYGHSCFTVEANGCIVALDPYKAVRGFDDVNLKANVLICSHEHFDHNYSQGVHLENSGRNTLKISSIPCYHDEHMGKDRGLNKISIIDDGINKVAHLGDLGHDLSDEACKQLNELDVIMIPVGGVYTIDASMAAKLVRRLNPKHIIPMHYKDGPRGLNNLAEADDFIKLLSREEREKLLLVKAYGESIEI